MLRKLTCLLSLAGLFLCLHAICLAVFGANSLAANYPFEVLAPLCALIACVWRAQCTEQQRRLPWILLSVALFLWNVGMLLATWEDIVRSIPFSVTFYSDFTYFLYGAPILLAISSPLEDQRIPLFVWLDGIQLVLTAYLTYITLFAVMPFTSTIIHPISVSLLIQTYNVENFLLAIAATLRLLAQPKSREDKRFFQILCAFLWNYAIFALVYNRRAVTTQGSTAYVLLVDIPFMLLAVAAMLPIESKEESVGVVRKKLLAVFIENASTMFYTLALSAMGIFIMRAHYLIGITAVGIALVVYGIRTITLQTRYVQAHQSLQEISSQLEEISLKDGLTNVANRRCFDQRLATEWIHAVRTKHALSLLLIDIDYFKNLNDKRGHTYGDECLIEIARILQSKLPRMSDLLARYGGEEFAVILPSTNREGAQIVATRMQEAVRSLLIRNETAVCDFVTISVGIAVYEFPQEGSAAALVEAADRALYKAKQNGRNLIEHSVMQVMAIPEPIG